MNEQPVISLPVKEDITFPTLIGKKPPKKPKRRSVVWQGVRLGRAPTAFERWVLSLQEIPRRFAEEQEQTVAELLAQRVQFLPAVVQGGVDTGVTACAEVLRAAQGRMAAFGAGEVRKEVARQSGVLNLGEKCGIVPLSQTVTSLTATADLAAHGLDAAWRAEVRRADLRLLRAKRTASLTDRAAFANKRVSYGLAGAVRGILNAAFVAGRMTAMKALTRAAISLDDNDVADLVDYVVQSAVLDTVTCDPCRDADGEVFEFGSDAQQEYEPPYYDCDGGDNCRCIQIAVIGNWRDRSEVEDAVDIDRVLVSTEKQAQRIIKRRQSGK